jgi:NitT/TauT family transport system substrate-binding protein
MLTCSALVRYVSCGHSNTEGHEIMFNRASTLRCNFPTIFAKVISRAVGVAVALSLIPFGVASATDKLSLRLDWTPHGVHAPIFLAAQKGWFEKAGLDVSIEDGNGSVVAVQLVGVGQFDIGHASLSSVAIARGKGLPVISVAGIVRKSDMGVLIPAGSGWKTAKDLEGKKVAYTAGSLEGPFMDAFFGASKGKVELLNVDAATKVGIYLSGEADAVVSTVPYVLPIVKAKRPSDSILFASTGLALPGFGFFTTEKKLKEKTEAIKRFTNVVLRSWLYILDGHVDEGVDAIIKERPQVPLNAQILKDEIEGYRPFMDTENSRNLPFGAQSEVDWANTLHAMEAAGVIKTGSKPSDYFTNALIDTANQAGSLK